jgi:hypothetical protein
MGTRTLPGMGEVRGPRCRVNHPPHLALVLKKEHSCASTPVCVFIASQMVKFICIFTFFILQLFTYSYCYIMYSYSYVIYSYCCVYVFLLLCLYIHIVVFIYSYCYIMYSYFYVYIFLLLYYVFL